MSYVDAISNALAARGNALAQGELQRGAVYGNLARNLGEIPGQAIAFHQQRQAALENSQLKKLAIEDAQREAEMEKELISIRNSGLPPDQMYAEVKRVASQSPKHFLEFQKAESEMLARKQQLEHQQKMEESQTFRDQLAFQGAQKGGSGVPVSMPTPTGLDLSRGNALSPAVPLAQPNIPPVRINPDMTTKFGVIPGQPTAAEELVQKKDLASFTAGLKTHQPVNLSDLEGYVENMAQEHKRTSGQEATPGQRAQWLKEIMIARAQAGVQGSPSQFIGFGPDGKPIGYVPSKKGTAGKLASVDATTVPPGPILSKTESAQEGMNANNAKSGLRAVKTVRDMLADPTILAQASIPGSPGARKFDTARKEMVDVLTRLRTGAALNTDEEAFYTGQAPVLLDLTDPDAIEYKLKMFEDIYNPIANRRTGGAAPTAPTGGGLDPKKKARLEELRRKKAAGTLGK